MINRAVLVGRLTRDADLRYTQSGVAVAQFTVAVNRTFTNSAGEREADYVQCVIWRKAAENFNKFTEKGSLVGIDGRIQTRHYDNDQGNRVYVTEVIVDNFSLLESRREAEQRTNRKPAENNQQQPNNNNGSNSNQSNNQQQSNNNESDPFADNSRPIDISDDDLPF